MDNQDLVLLILDAAGRQPLSPVQLQKSVFLISQASLSKFSGVKYEFDAYHYGPFSREIYDVADQLQAKGLVVRTRSDKGNWVDTCITEEGSNQADALWSQLDEPSGRYVKELVGWVYGQSFSSLLKAVYNAYPAYRENSVFQG